MRLRLGRRAGSTGPPQRIQPEPRGRLPVRFRNRQRHQRISSGSGQGLRKGELWSWCYWKTDLNTSINMFYYNFVFMHCFLVLRSQTRPIKSSRFNSEEGEALLGFSVGKNPIAERSLWDGDQKNIVMKPSSCLPETLYVSSHNWAKGSSHNSHFFSIQNQCGLYFFFV